MIAAISLILVLTVSLLVTRVATVALAHTGLSREAARFQARSALTGVGYTTQEAEKVVNHPVRRKILMLLMLVGNAGIVTVLSSAILTFVGDDEGGSWWWRLVLIVIGIAALWTAAQSQWLDKRISKYVSYLLKRYTDIDVRDYSGILHLGGDYQIAELLADPDGWLVNRKLAELRLRDEGIVVLGVQTPGGKYFGAPTGDTEIKPGFVLWLYGRADTLADLDERRSDAAGHMAHSAAVAEQDREERKQKEALEEEAGSDDTESER